MRRRLYVFGWTLALGLGLSGTPTHAQTVSIDDVRLLEENGGSEATTFTFTVTLSMPAAIVVQADWKTTDGTAVAGPIGTGDFTLASGAVVFPIGNTSQTVDIKVHGDLDVEPDEVFYVDLTGASGATLLTSRGIGAILDDDTVRPGVQAFGVVSDGDAANGRNRLQWFVPGGAAGAIGVVVRYDEGPSCSAPTLITGGTGLPVAAPPAPDTAHLEPHEFLVIDREYCYSVWLDYGGGNYSTTYESRNARPFDTTAPPGKIRWKYFTGTTTLAAPTVGFDAIIVPSNDQYIHALERDPVSPAAGTWPPGWRPPKLESLVQHRVPVVPFAAGSRAFVSTQNGWVHSVDTANGDLLWSTPLPEGAAQGAPAGIFTQYGGAYDYILAGTSAGGAPDLLYALDPFTGSVIDFFPRPLGVDGIWDEMGEVLGMPSVDYAGGQVFFASRFGTAGLTVWCVGLGPPPDALRALGAVGWTAGTNQVDGSVVLRNGRVFVGDISSEVWSFNASDGADSRSITLGGDGSVKGFLFPDSRSNDLYGATNSRVWAVTDTGVSINHDKWSPEPSLVAPSVVLHHPFTDDIYVGVRGDYPNVGDGAAVVKIDAATGAVVGWVRLEGVAQTIGAPSLDLAYGMLYMGSEAGIIYAVELGF
jgi:outer membrane protein assembly factor BamB